MKKLFCLLLAVLMLLGLASCGDDNGANAGNDAGSTTQGGSDSNGSTESETDDTVWILVKEHSMGSKRYTKYIYDEQGNLIGGEYYNGTDKMGDYQYVTTEKADGGKTMEVRYKSVSDSDYITDGVMELDSQGRITRYQEYDLFGKVRDFAYTFTYDKDGKLIEQIGSGDGGTDKKLTLTYDGDRLVQTHYTESDGDYTIFRYTYDSNGIPASVQMEYDSMDYQSSASFAFEVKESDGVWKLRSAKDAPNPLDNRDLFVTTIDYTDDGQVHSVKVDAKTWGVFCVGWVPTVEMGCLDVDNFFYGTAQLVYMPLDVYLAEQNAQ